MCVHLVIITSDEKHIIDNVRSHLNPPLQRVFTDIFQDLKVMLVNPLPVGCTLLVSSL